MTHFAATPLVALTLASAPFLAQAATIEVRSTQASTFIGEGAAILAQDTDVRSPAAFLSTSQTIEEGPSDASSSVGVDFNFRIIANAFQNAEQISTAEFSSSIASGDPVVYDITAETGTLLRITNDNSVDANLFYEFGLSGMMLDIQNVFGDGRNPFTNPLAQSSGIRMSYVIFATPEGEISPTDSVSTFQHFDTPGFEYRANYEIFTQEVGQNGTSLRTGRVENLSGTVIPYKNVNFTRGFNIAIDDVSGVLDLGVVAPGGFVDLEIYSRVLGISYTGEDVLSASIGDPGGAPGSAYSVPVGPTPVPLPAGLPLLALALAGLVGLRRRAG